MSSTQHWCSCTYVLSQGWKAPEALPASGLTPPRHSTGRIHPDAQSIHHWVSKMLLANRDRGGREAAAVSETALH